MSTRSYIFVENEDGTLDGIYCHFDGYLDGVGTVLLKSYNGAENEAKRQELIGLGDLSCIGASLETSPAVEMFGFDYFNDDRYLALSKHTQSILNDSQDFICTVAYHRDRGDEKQTANYESLEELLRSVSVHDFMMIAYIYIWHAGCWWVLQNGNLGKLKQAIDKV